MSKRWKLRLLYLVLGLCAFAPLSQAQVLVQTGHTAPIRDVSVDSESRIFASAGADGSVKVWDDSGRLLSRLDVGPYPLTKVELQQDSDLLAVVQELGPQEYRVAVWDWRRERQRYRTTESTPITHLAFSPRGSYLVYAVSDIRSLRFLDASTGERETPVDVSFGVVTYFVVARSERNIMTYTPATGEIFYFDLDSGRRIESLRIGRELQEVTLLPTRRHVVAVSGDELRAYDIVDGDLEARTTVGDIASLTVHPDSGAIAVLKTDGELVGYRFSGGDLSPLFWNAQVPTWRPGALSYAGPRLLGGTEAGELEYLPFGADSPSVLAERIVDSVSSVVGHGNSLYVATTRNLFSLSSSMVTNGDLDDADGSIRFRRSANPVGNPGHLAVSDDGTLLAWRPGSRAGGLQEITNLRTPERVEDITQGIRSITVGPDSFVVVQADGAVASLDTDSLEVEPLYSAVGIETAVRLAGNRVVVGKTRADTFDSALLEIDTVTGETVVLPTEAFLAYRLAVAPNNRVLYAIELIRRGDETSTALTRYSGASFDRRRVLAERNEEVLDAVLLVAPDNGRLISDLPTGELAEYDGRRWVPYESASSFPVSAAVFGSLIVAAGNDGAVYAWDRDSRRLRYTLQVFRDGEWVIFSDNRRFIPSSDAVVSRLTTTETRFGQRAEVDRYQLDVRVIER
jgi:WD40 repeat protein